MAITQLPLVHVFNGLLNIWPIFLICFHLGIALPLPDWCWKIWIRVRDRFLYVVWLIFKVTWLLKVATRNEPETSCFWKVKNGYWLWNNAWRVLIIKPYKNMEKFFFLSLNLLIILISCAILSSAIGLTAAMLIAASAVLVPWNLIFVERKAEQGKMVG